MRSHDSSRKSQRINNQWRERKLPQTKNVTTRQHMTSFFHCVTVTAAVVLLAFHCLYLLCSIHRLQLAPIGGATSLMETLEPSVSAPLKALHFLAERSLSPDLAPACCRLMQQPGSPLLVLIPRLFCVTHTFSTLHFTPMQHRHLHH